MKGPLLSGKKKTLVAIGARHVPGRNHLVKHIKHVGRAAKAENVNGTKADCCKHGVL